MNERAVAYAFKHSPCSGGPFVVHIAMAYHSDRTGLVCATTGEVAAMARTTPNAVRRAQAHLLAEGVIEQVAEAAGPRSATYRLARNQRRAERATSGAVAVEPPRPQRRASVAVDANAPLVESLDLRDRHKTLDTTDSGSVSAIFAAWQEATGHSRSVLDAKRRTAIVNARKLYPDADLVAAVWGVTLFDHNMGGTNGTRYDDIALVLRDAAHIERFRDAWLNRGERRDPRRHKVVGGLARALQRGTTAIQ